MANGQQALSIEIKRIHFEKGMPSDAEVVSIVYVHYSYDFLCKSGTGV